MLIEMVGKGEANDHRFRPREHDVEEGPPDPISGGAGAVVGTMTSMMMGVADFPIATLKVLAIHPDAPKSKKSKKKTEGGEESSASTTPSGGASSMTLVSSNAGSTPRDSIEAPSTPTTPGSKIFSEPEELSRESTVPLSTVNSGSDVSSVRSPRGSSLANAMRDLPEASRPRSRSRAGSPARHSSQSHSRHGSTASRPKAEHHQTWSEAALADATPDALDTAFGTGKGVSKIVGAGLKSPMDLLMGVSKGFHNLPKLYGEEVRQTGRVTGIKSGLQTAGKVRSSHHSHCTSYG